MSENLDASHYQFDLTIDATGVPKVAESLIKYTANGGVIIFYGVCPQESNITINPYEIFRRQLKIVGSHSLNKNIPESLAVLRSQKATLDKLIFSELAMESIESYMAFGNSKGLKIQLNLDNG